MEETKPTRRKLMRRLLLYSMMLVFLTLLTGMQASAAVTIDSDGSGLLEILQVMTLLGLIPSILMMATCFTRIVIVLSFLRSALGLQATPPNQVLIGIALFLSLFIMSPVLAKIDTTAYQPYKNEEITQEEFLQKASIPLKEFMLKQTKKDDLSLFTELSKTQAVEDPIELPVTTVIPAFVTSELRRAFMIGFLLYIPFVIIDLIVSSTLMSVGMMMLPPTMISLPFKLLLFVLVDGWGLLFQSLVSSFNL